LCIKHHGTRAPRRLRAGGISHVVVRRQFKLARTCVVSGQLSADRIAAEVSFFSRRSVQGGISVRIGTARHPLARGERAVSSPHRTLSSQRRRKTTGVRGATLPAGSPLEGPSAGL